MPFHAARTGDRAVDQPATKDARRQRPALGEWTAVPEQTRERQIAAIARDEVVAQIERGRSQGRRTVSCRPMESGAQVGVLQGTTRNATRVRFVSVVEPLETLPLNSIT